MADMFHNILQKGNIVYNYYIFFISSTLFSVPKKDVIIAFVIIWVK